ncbi:glutamyl-tRNA reductase [Pasteurella canis]|nr:glutamyl-tRNA reductase [Pasteurella canis]
MLRHGVNNIMIANRTIERAQKLVEKLDDSENIQILSLEQLQEGLNQADIVISSTSSPSILISQEMVKLAQKSRCYYRCY